MAPIVIKLRLAGALTSTPDPIIVLKPLLYILS